MPVQQAVLAVEWLAGPIPPAKARPDPGDGSRPALARREGAFTQPWLTACDDAAAQVTGENFYHQKPQRMHPLPDDKMRSIGRSTICAAITGAPDRVTVSGSGGCISRSFRSRSPAAITRAGARHLKLKPARSSEASYTRRTAGDQETRVPGHQGRVRRGSSC